ncbi:sigma 54-interacting transcriptional regulator [Methylomicrobium sp. Wu6]|uniref:sigma 54-interacting transcriptional regulator n=1 Tax=Methylomicrobium sp. Wu6 TaxID=3107928 RepID=UPI002DD6B426|nr:sigma 54-interacting transcriptional regulator [Methylomicrobium sp. Wu6]MEC4749841.1 sigma 54-interacting transcriptional regulator [Methylomicrobium sp. Wu6]
MSSPSLSGITPVFFLQTFILELMHANEQLGQKHCEELIEHIAKTAGCFFEETYRDDTHNNNALDIENYTELILGLKNSIGGKFSLVSANQDCITVSNSCCPFGEQVVNFPGLCRMTSSVFGGIAARNFGYAKVEIKKSIARQHGSCEVCVYTSPHAASGRSGTEYTDTTPVKQMQDIHDLCSRIEESMLQLWRKQRKPATKMHQPPAIVANSPSMRKILQSIEVIAPTTATVLVQGQTGVGKELVAKAIHAMSDRSQKPFIPVNCGAIPESLVESALFGHEKGAFTGAIEVHQGYFERAEGGTLFLDEVDSLSAAAQIRLLRVLQEGELERVGGKKILPVDLRIISATNNDLEDLVSQNVFRKDLYYRINVVRLRIPPLSERPEDLPYLVQLIVRRLSKKYGKTVETVSRDVMQKIRAYAWPGNVRELENVLERSILFASGKEMTELDLELSGPTASDDWKGIRESALARVERAYLDSALKHHQGDVKKVADAMGVTTRAVYGKLQKYGIESAAYKHHRSAGVSVPARKSNRSD